MNVIKVSPRGFCVGVVDALKIAVDAAMDPTLPRPIYILGNIVHNHAISLALTELGLITIDEPNIKRIDLLDQISSGTVLFTAHGVSDMVIEKAKQKGLTLINATCKYVTKTNEYIKEKLNQGYDIIYIGKKNHPEPEGALGINPEKIHLVENLSDIEVLKIDNPRLTITNQTTMSLWDIESLSQAIKNKYPTSEFENEICKATQVRQQAILKEAIHADLTLVVGDPLSNNSNKLVKISEEKAHTKAYLIETVADIHPDWLIGCQTVAVTSGASTPTAITQEVIAYLNQFDEHNPLTYAAKSKLTSRNILPMAHKKAD